MVTAKATGSLPPCGFLVTATKAGQVPISIEKRAKGKRVTVVSNVQGNAKGLCTALTTLLGVGGTTHERGPKAADVEVQGEQMQRVSAALLQLGCVRGLARTREAAAAVVQRDSAFDDVLNVACERKPRSTAPPPMEPPPHDAPCRAWHGDWLYCRGHCEPPADGYDAWDLWTEAQPASSSSPVRKPTGTLEAALRSLGMLAEMGEAVREWVSICEQRREDTLRRFSNPQTSVCYAPSKAATNGHFACRECGAVFSLQKTLKKHMQLHEDERAGVIRGHTGASTAATETSETSWRSSTYEQAAVWAAAEEGWGCDYDEDYYSDPDDHAAPHPASSLSSWVTVAVDRSSKKKREQQKKASAELAALVACPICGDQFPMSDIEQHVDACLACPPASSSTAPVDEGSADSSQQLPPELLESLLDLDLSPEAAELFWIRYEDALLKDHTSMEQAFLIALERTISDEWFDDPKVSDLPCSSRVQTSRAEVWDAAGDSTKGQHAEKADGFCVVQSKRSNRWDKSKAASIHMPATAPSLSSAAKAPTTGPVLRQTQQDSRKDACRPARRVPPPKAKSQSKPASTTTSTHRDALPSASEPIGQPETTACWLRRALVPLLPPNDAEAVLAGIEVILGCNGDSDAAENAVALLEAELPEDSPQAAAVVNDFKRRLAVL